MPTQAVLEFTVGPTTLDERNLVLDSWMRSSRWRRSRILRVLDRGRALVARSPGGVALGWIAWDTDGLAYVFVKSAYRRLGLAEALYEAAGRPKRVHAPIGQLGKRLARQMGLEVLQ